jgi:hypothetical protein
MNAKRGAFGLQVNAACERIGSPISNRWRRLSMWIYGKEYNQTSSIMKYKCAPLSTDPAKR